MVAAQAAENYVEMKNGWWEQMHLHLLKKFSNRSKSTKFEDINPWKVS